MATPYEYAILSEHAYRDTDAPALPDGWSVLVDFIQDPDTDKGYFGAAYVKKDLLGNPLEVVIAHRGTELSDIPDFVSNSSIAFGNVPDQFAISQSFVNTVEATLEAQFGSQTAESLIDNSLSHTGHSLGATLVQGGSGNFDTAHFTLESRDDETGERIGVNVNLYSGTYTATMVGFNDEDNRFEQVLTNGFISSVENIIGSFADDVLTGNDKDNVILTEIRGLPSGGNDTIFGRGGNDYISASGFIDGGDGDYIMHLARVA